jgi:uncharacterized protein YoxC
MWTDDEWLPPKDRVSDKDLEDLWESHPRDYHSVIHENGNTYVMVRNDLAYQHNLEDVVLDLKSDKDDLRKAIDDGISVILDLRKQLAEARKPDETEALAALREDMARVQEKQRNEIKSLKAQLDEQTKKARGLQDQINERIYQVNNAMRSARSLVSSLSSLTVADDPVTSRLPGVLGDAQRAIEDATKGGNAIPPPITPVRKTKFSDLEID